METHQPIQSLSGDISTVLQKAKVGNVKIHQRLFYFPLYIGTALERTNQIENTETIYKKNIYYLARKTINVSAVLGHMVQRGLITMDDREGIVNGRTLWDSDLLQAMEAYIIAFRKEDSKFEKLITVLHVTKNEDIIHMINSNLHRNATANFREAPVVNDAKISEGKADKNQLPVVVENWIPKEQIKVERKDNWLCKRCTFLNPPNNDNCEMCSAIPGKAEVSEEILGGCLKCTLINIPEAIICAACGMRLKEEPAELLRDEVVADEDWDAN